MSPLALVISPHPDDETLGCGGTILRHLADGDRVKVVILSSGERGGHELGAEETTRLREAEAREAAEVLGYGEPEFWHAPDGAIRDETELIERLRNALLQHRPSIVYCPQPMEMHPDHAAAAAHLRAAVRGMPNSERPEVRLYEVWTPLTRVDLINDITGLVERKRAAIACYASQLRYVAFDDAILGLNRYRGELLSWPEGEYAEVFEILSP